MRKYNDVKLVEIANKRYILKRADNNKGIAFLENEYNILNKLQEYSFVPKILDFTKNASYAQIIITYIDGQNMKPFLYTFDEKKQIAIELLNCLKIINSLGIIHADIKPNNILIDKNKKVYLIDFETSFIGNHTCRYGSIAYMPLEQIKKEPLDFHSNIYTVGIIIYYLFYDSFPFENDREKIISRKMKCDFILGNNISINSIFLKACSFLKKDRYSSYDEMIKDILKLEN